MSRTEKFFLVLLLTGPIHMAEQLLTSIEEFHMIRRTVIEPYFSMFSPANADWATVLLITIVGTVLSAAFFALSAGGRTRLVALGIFGLMGAGEIHHVFEALSEGGYDPGVMTSIPYFASGCGLMAAAWREWSASRQPTPIVASLRAASTR
jgi:hypothetical protein